MLLWRRFQKQLVPTVGRWCHDYHLWMHRLWCSVLGWSPLTYKLIYPKQNFWEIPWIIPLSLSLTKDRQLAACAILQVNEIGSLPSLSTKDFHSNKNNQLDSSFSSGSMWFPNNFKAECNLQEKDKYCLHEAWNFRAQECHLVLQDCFVTRVCSSDNLNRP